ncbi:MAG: hypothetical protein VX294_13430 [Candidatus Latescibacterota bacterium]|nr:hypothetical protein [Candidatus Latescibacterota bacterium]
MWKIIIAPTARMSLERVLNRQIRGTIDRGIHCLSRNPWAEGRSLCGPLRGLRVAQLEGDWCRIIFRIVDKEIQIVSIKFDSAQKKKPQDFFELARNLFRLRLL